MSNKLYYERFKGNPFANVDTVLKEIFVSKEYYGSIEKRSIIAQVNGIENYNGSISDDAKLIDLAKKGKLKRV